MRNEWHWRSAMAMRKKPKPKDPSRRAKTETLLQQDRKAMTTWSRTHYSRRPMDVSSETHGSHQDTQRRRHSSTKARMADCLSPTIGRILLDRRSVPFRLLGCVGACMKPAFTPL